MEGLLCIHGHFYQPPREDPWLECVLPEGTAAPDLNWNRRILHESYAPLAFARRLDGSGRVSDIVNCFEWMNFNVGPTLLSWLESRAPQIYARILAADQRSYERWGHGNAMAQVYHHTILPLASDRDRRLEVQWALDDFAVRFGRNAEGIWLSEAAVDVPTLEILAEQGVRFTILSPRQAVAVASPGQDWQPVDETQINVRFPYRVDLPSGRNIAVFFYNGPLSQAVAFEGLLTDGERFWRRLAEGGPGGLLSIGTDGETYGHHFRFGEMALAYVLEQARQHRDGWSLTNYAAYLSSHPPQDRVRLREPSSWSCAHGVERWRSDCGCRDGGHPEWNQAWRSPLRSGLNTVKQGLDKYFDEAGQEFFLEPGTVLSSYGGFLAGHREPRSFVERYFKSGLSPENIEKAWNLLEMQRFGLAMFASCAWFFDEVSRVEPRNALAFCLRAMECCRLAGGPDLEPELLKQLERIRPNEVGYADGVELFEREVRSRQQTPSRLIALALIRLGAGGRIPEPGDEAVAEWPGVLIEVTRSLPDDTDEHLFSGSALVRMRHAGRVPGRALHCIWRWDGRSAADALAGEILVRCSGEEALVRPTELHWKMRQGALLEAMDAASQTDWAALTEHAGRVAFFQEFRPHQHEPQWAAFWAAQWPVLALAYIREGRGLHHQDLVAFLLAIGKTHPARDWLEQRLGREMQQRVVDETEFMVARLPAMLDRARSIGVEIDLWGVQNQIWERGLHRTVPELAASLGLTAP